MSTTVHTHMYIYGTGTYIGCKEMRPMVMNKTLLTFSAGCQVQGKVPY
jgi:hypothetical protein